jgi:hypothetical protein
VAQGGLRNVAKHAKTKQAWVTLEGAGDRIRPRVEDRGSGFPVESLASTAGLRISDHAGAGAAYERELRNPLEAWTGHEDRRGIAEPMKPARLLLGDDHALILTGIRTWLEPYYEAVGSAGDSRSLVGAALRILNGIDAARQIKKAWPEAKLLFLSMHSNPVHLREALEAARDGPSEWLGRLDPRVAEYAEGWQAHQRWQAGDHWELHNVTFNGINLNNVDDLMNRTYSSKEPCFDYGHNQSRYQDLEAKIFPWQAASSMAFSSGGDHLPAGRGRLREAEVLPASADMGGVHPGNAQSCCYGRRPDVSEHRLNFL